MAERSTPQRSASDELAQVEQQLHQVEAQIESLLQSQSQLQERREQLLRLAAADARAPRADWATASFPWDTQVQSLLGSVFGLSAWRPLQREVINATLQGRDALCLMPAGGGKSLCYQLTALVAPAGSVSLVVSPLLALIVDQIAHLQKLNIAVSALTSLSTKEELSDVMKSLDQPLLSPRLLYCTPERIASSKRFMAKLEKLYKAGRLVRIAIDESHCASQWGNDFRPDYRKLGVLRQQFPDTPILALTATATASVCTDVTNILHIDGAEVFRSSIDRPNLFYEVKSKPSTAAELADDIATWIKSNFPAGDSGIVYCLTRKDTESTAGELSQRGIACAAYHADMDATTRMSVHTAWSEGSLQVIVATVAFGMGVSKSDVRFVIHHTMSKSCENYYQESGRAGRDGKPAHCRLYYRFGDYLRQASVVSMESAWETHLRSMLRYAGGAGGGCRRAALCRHFAEAPAPCHRMCDTCAGRAVGATVEKIDVTEAAKGALEVLKNWAGAEKRATLTQLVDKWRTGPGGALAKQLGREECERVVEGLVSADILRLDFGFTAYSTNVYLKVGPKANIVLEGRQKVEIAAVVERGPETEVAIKPGEANTWGEKKKENSNSNGTAITNNINTGTLTNKKVGGVGGLQANLKKKDGGLKVESNQCEASGSKRPRSSLREEVLSLPREVEVVNLVDDSSDEEEDFVVVAPRTKK